MIDVQLYAHGASITFNSATDAGTIRLTNFEFDSLAEKVAEAALNKKGRTALTVDARDIQVGDFILDREVVNVRPDKPASGLVTINLRPFGYTLLETTGTIQIERPIQ